jgi:hypothetical protein
VAVTDNPDDSMEALEVVRKVNDDVNTHWRTNAVEDVDEMAKVAGVLDGVTLTVSQDLRRW